MSNRHFATFYGRPKAHITELQEQITTGRSRNARKIDTTTGTAQRIIAGLSAQDQSSVEDYVQRREDDFALAAMILILDWVLGNGLPPHTLRRILQVPWGEELTGEYDRGTP